MFSLYLVYKFELFVCSRTPMYVLCTDWASLVINSANIVHVIGIVIT